MSGEGRSLRKVGVALVRRLQTPAGKVAAIVGFVSACFGIYQFFVHSPEPAPALTSEQSRLLNVMPQKLGRNCSPYDPGFSQRYATLVAADVECAPLDPGPDSVKFHLFNTPRKLEEFMRRQLSEMSDTGIGCTSGDFTYSSPWVDSTGRPIGELLCGDYSGRSRLTWSYDDLLVVASAGSRPADADTLHAWWQRYVRFDGKGPSLAQRRYLESLLPPSFRRCHPRAILQPMSLAGIICAPGEGISSAGAELFANRAMLKDYLDQKADLWGIGDESCGEDPFSYMSYGWGPDYQPTLGYLLCRPQEGVEWFEWTAEPSRVYAFASREDSDFERLYEQWTQSLSWIKGVRPHSRLPVEPG